MKRDLYECSIKELIKLKKETRDIDNALTYQLSKVFCNKFCKNAKLEKKKMNNNGYDIISKNKDIIAEVKSTLYAIHIDKKEKLESNQIEKIKDDLNGLFEYKADKKITKKEFSKCINRYFVMFKQERAIKNGKKQIKEDIERLFKKCSNGKKRKDVNFYLVLFDKDGKNPMRYIWDWGKKEFKEKKCIGSKTKK